MPYLKDNIKKSLDDGWIPKTAGELTYCLQKQLHNFIEGKIKCGGYHYEDLAVCLGALEGAKADLIQRVIEPYEVEKHAINGDVWLI